MQAQAMAQAAVGRRSQQLRRIEAALQRLEDDESAFAQPVTNHQSPAFSAGSTVLMCINCAAQSEQN